jgi:hypothetical protein
MSWTSCLVERWRNRNDFRAVMPGRRDSQTEWKEGDPIRDSRGPGSLSFLVLPMWQVESYLMGEPGHNPEPEDDHSADSPLERFHSLTKKLIAVPKKEIDALRERERRQNKGPRRRAQ